MKRLDELIIKVLDRRATMEEAEAVERWRRQAPANEARFQAVREVWAATHPTTLPEEVDLSVVPRIIQAAAEREGNAREGEANRAAPVPGGRGMGPRLRWALPMAAALAAVAFGIHEWSRNAAREVALEAPGPGSQTFVLDDGSIVRLAQGSRLSAMGAGPERRFELEGTALFAVAHLEGDPFVVWAGGVETRVLGTRFEVRTLGEGRRRIAVLEGRVEVRTPQGQAEVEAGEVSVASPGLPPSLTRPEDLLGLLDWPEGTLLFQNTPLVEVAREVSRRYGVDVRVEGEALRATRISAWYGTEPFRDVVESLCNAAGASCSVTDTLAVLR